MSDSGADHMHDCPTTGPVLKSSVLDTLDALALLNCSRGDLRQ